MRLDLKPLETVYAGVRFRSRLEARWAVAFDAAGWAWAYEPEAYALPSGNYLPDFWLPDFDVWAEVKPQPCVDPRPLEMVAASGSDLWLLCGQPATLTPDVTVFWRGEAVIRMEAAHCFWGDAAHRVVRAVNGHRFWP